jgi:hypothetical protein
MFVTPVFGERKYGYRIVEGTSEIQPNLLREEAEAARSTR